MSDQAMKLFEALSGVDEELLERCNRKENRKNTTVYRLSGRYGKAMAACVCLIVVCAAAWSGYRFVTGPYGSDASGSNGASAQVYDMERSSLGDCGSNGESGGAGLEDGMAGSSMASAGGTGGGEPGCGADGIHTEDTSSADAVEAAMPKAEQESADCAQQMAADKTDGMSSSVNNYTASTASSLETGIHEKENAVERMEEMLQKESQLSDSRAAVPWEEAIVMEPFAGYLPAVLPAGYEPFSARRSLFPDSWNNMIFKWSEGEHIFSLDMTLGEIKTREDIEKSDGVNEYLAAEFRKELIPEPLDGQIWFTLYYGDGMRIDFAGYITVDEMWEVVEAVSK